MHVLGGMVPSACTLFGSSFHCIIFKIMLIIVIWSLEYCRLRLFLKNSLLVHDEFLLLLN